MYPICWRRPLNGFWKRIKRKCIDIKYVATDLSAAFISSVYEHCPNAVHVFGFNRKIESDGVLKFMRSIV